MLSFLPAQIGQVLTFLLAGTGSNAAELSRFFDLHIVVLPAGLLALLVVKMYMFEVHGAAEPPTGQRRLKEVPWFPDVFLYFALIGSVFVAVILLASALFPISLSAEFTPQAASNYVPQPEWYFLWLYQILKFASFEGEGIYYALGAVTIILALFILLPFIDRGTTRDAGSRPLYTTVGLILIAELVTLTVWGYFTPGQVIPDLQAVVILGEAAVAVAMMTALTYRMRSRMRGLPSRGLGLRILKSLFTHKAITIVFVTLLAIGSVGFAGLVSSLSMASVEPVAASLNLIVLLFSFFLMVRILRSLTLKHRRAII
jgi:quinol-cytochrome oxidoreductase complex cytochrome b subunit